MAAPGTTNADARSSWGELIPPATRIRIAVVAGLFLLAYWGVIRNILAARWLRDGNWSHGWLIPLFSLYFLSTRRQELSRIQTKPSYFGAGVLAAALASYFYSAWFLRMAYPQALSIVVALLGVTLLLGGWHVLRVALFPILFLLLAVPLPHSIYVDLTMPLRQWASEGASALMPLFAPGLHTEAQAVVIDYVLPGVSQGSLNIEEACSGMRLMMAFVTLGVAMAYLGERPLWHRLLMVASCVPIAVLCNTIRVTVTGLLHVYGRPDLSRGTPHQLMGIASLAIAMGLFSLIGYVLGHLFVEEPEEEPS